MAGFTFRLEQVLQYRKQLEEQAMQELAAATETRNSIITLISQIETDLHQQRIKLSEPANLTPQERWLIYEYEKALQDDLLTQRKRLIEAEDTVDKCHVTLVKKAQERNLLDKLKEKQAARFAQEERLKEQRNYDETATLRFTPASF